MDNDLPERANAGESSNKRLALLSIAGVLLVFYFFQWYLGNPETRFQLLDLAFAAFFTIAIYFWCQLDAQEHGAKLSTLFGIGLLFFGPFAVMYYFFRTRGFQRGLRSIGWMLLFGLAVLFASVIEIVILTLISDRMGLLKDA